MDVESSAISESDPARIIGKERMKSDMRQLGGLLLVLGLGAAHSALALTAVLVEGMGGRSQFVGFRLPALCATIIQTALGMAAMGVGFATMIWTPVSARAHLVVKILVGIVNLGPISFFIAAVRMGQGAKEPPEESEFIPSSLSPSSDDLSFVVTMGIMALVSVCGTLIGGLTVVGLNLCAYLGKQPVDKHRGYYILRYAYYCILVVLGGISQLLLGIYLGMRFGWGPYDNAVHVAVYTVFFPCVTVVVGVVQTLYGIYGWCRALGWVTIQGKGDSSFMVATLVTWIITMVLQILLQPSYATGSEFDAEGATYAAVYVGFFVMPAWLDYMVRHTPNRVDPAYFGLPVDTRCREDLLCRLFGLTADRFNTASSLRIRQTV